MTSKSGHTSSGNLTHLFAWGRELLYLGAAPSQPNTHQVSHDKLMLSLEGTFKVTVRGGRKVRTRSCAIAMGMRHAVDSIDCRDAVAATWLFSPFSQDFPAMTKVMTSAQEGIFYDHANEAALINGLKLIRSRETVILESTRTRLRSDLLPPELRTMVFRAFDPRVILVARRILATVNLNLPLDTLASEVNLSSSHLEKMFKEQIGVPMTQFRLRYRTYVATLLLVQGHTITEAAMKAGFASSSHFSRTHQALTGETASNLFLKPHLRAAIDDCVLRDFGQVLGKAK